MRVALTLGLSSIILLPSLSFADPCTEVVSDTVAEMQAGADGWWSEDTETLVRAAAGSACIKAQSKRYEVAGEATLETVTAGTTAAAVSTARESVSGTVAGTSADAAAQPVAGDSGDAGDADAESDGSWSIGGLTIRSMSGSPSQKPYERARQTKKEEEK